MVNAILYYRLFSNNTDAGNIPDPNNLPAAQKLAFDASDKVTEAIQKTRKNNIKSWPANIGDGTKRINKNDNGMLSEIYKVNGNFKNPDADADVQKLLDFEDRLQLEFDNAGNNHEFGIFGIYYPNAGKLNVDPTATKGLMIETTMLGHQGIKKTIYDFSVELSWGGTK